MTTDYEHLVFDETDYHDMTNVLVSWQKNTQDEVCGTIDGPFGVWIRVQNLVANILPHGDDVVYRLATIEQAKAYYELMCEGEE